MSETVKLQPNHYDVLGLAPGASDDEITRAFAREISPLRPHAIGDFAKVTLAYETLRDPLKRRAYDASLAPKPEREPPPTQWPRDGWPFVASARVESIGRAASGPLPRREPQASPQLPLETPAAPRTAPFVAAPRRDPAKSGARHSPSDRPRQPDLFAKAGLESQVQVARARATVPEEQVLEADDDVIQWKRPAIVGGALFLGVGLLGAWIGWDAGNDVVPEGPGQAVTLALPQAQAQAPSDEMPPEIESATAAVPIVAEAQPEWETGTAAATDAIAPTPPSPQPALAEEQQADSIPFAESPAELATEAVVEQSPAVEATSASLPLPESVIARTIRRIGYACGEVASAAPVEGQAAGVFKITCTSGDTYRAAPIRGRYHFRRWEG